MGTEPGCGDEEQAPLETHDPSVVKKEAGGHIVVISYPSLLEIIQQGQCYEEVYLYEAPNVAEGVVLCLDDVQHLGDNGAGEAGVDEGKVGQKEVHGSVELRV